MKSVIVRLQEYEKHASNAEKKFVEFLLKHPEQAVGCSIHRLAEMIFCSVSTIVRLCQKTGFDGYKELQRSLMYELAIRKENSQIQLQEISQQDSLEELVNKVTYKNIASLEDTRKLINLEELEQCICMMEEAGNIGLFGIGASLLVAKDFHLQLLRVNKNCYTAEDWHSQLLMARNMTEKDLAIIISYSGMTEEMIICAKTAKEQGAPVISISRFEDSPLAKLADCSLAVAATELIIRSGAMSSRIAQLGIVDILYTAYVTRNYEASMRQFRKTQISKPLC